MRGSQFARLAVSFALVCGSLASPGSHFCWNQVAFAQATDVPPVGKPDTPKLNTSPQASRGVTTGVQRKESPSHDDSKKLSDVYKKKNNTKLNGQTAKVNPARVTSQAHNANTLTSTMEGVGIIGVKFLLSFGHMPVINRVFPGTPAATMGLHARDIIVAVDGVPTLGLSKEDVYGMIVGKPATEVTISIKRGGQSMNKRLKRMDFNDIPDPSVRQDYLMSI